MADANWAYVCTLEDLPVAGARVVTRERGPAVALFRTGDDQVFALLDHCPHKGGPLSQGIVHGTQVTCPLHNYNIALDSGEVVAPDEGCTPRFTVLREGAALYLNRDELATLGLGCKIEAARPVQFQPAVSSASVRV